VGICIAQAAGMIKTKLLVALFAAFAMFSCGGDEESDGGFGGGDGDGDSYSNHIRLVCNDEVLIDKTFFSREECEAFARVNRFTCFGVEKPISC
jgi:hypothetical protein